MGTVRAYVPKGALCALRHSEDVLIFLSGELSAKFLNNNGEQERGWGGDGENGRALLSAAVRICLTILFPCSCRTFRRKIMLAVMTRSLDAINRQKCALILVVPHPIDGFVHDLYNDRKYCTRSRMCGEILSPC